ncbi:hypothetical protein PG997_002565 [Apiospora hydei]|uniref:Uncharacterized protein n=1 Tax=Apiospora hydei TaxID=1337664 RepID=A0ABR1WWW5_9PEZI
MAPTIFLFVTGAHRICGSLNEVPSDPWTLPPTRAKLRLSTAVRNQSRENAAKTMGSGREKIVNGDDGMRRPNDIGNASGQAKVPLRECQAGYTELRRLADQVNHYWLHLLGNIEKALGGCTR